MGLRESPKAVGPGEIDEPASPFLTLLRRCRPHHRAFGGKSGEDGSGLLSPAAHRQGEITQELAEPETRRLWVRARVTLTGHARGVIEAMGLWLKGSSVATLPGEACPVIPEELKEAMAPVLSLKYVLTPERPDRLEKSRATGPNLELAPECRRSGFKGLRGEPRKRETAS